MGDQQHVIRKVTIEVNIPSEESSHEIQEAISSAWWQAILAELEKILDKYASRKEVISIDKLEVDLGDIGNEAIEAELTEKAKERIEEKLLQVINAARTSRSPEVFDGSDRTTVTFRSTQTSRLELLMHFIQTGTMPWWARNEETSIQLLLEQLIVNEPAQLRSELLKLLVHNNYRKRFIYQLPDKSIKTVIALYDAAFAEFTSSIASDMEILRSAGAIPSFTSSALRYVMWDHFIQCITNGNTKTDEEEKISHVTALASRVNIDTSPLQVLSRIAEKIDQQVYTNTTNLLVLVNKAKAQVELSSQEEIKKQAGKKEEAARRKEKGNSESEEAASSGDEDKDIFANEEERIAREEQKKQTIADKLKELFGKNDPDDLSAVLSDGVYINNAGIVLLWPYLSAFFTKLGLVKGNAFVSDDASQHAVHLLQYLATGNEAPAEEHALVLNKLLCGIDPGDPVNKDVFITAEEKEECDLLLQAVVSNWTALKRSSTEALRSTFLMKEGCLAKEGAWSLKIERQAVDMLIDKLPWSISIIKLPWWSEMLYVEW